MHASVYMRANACYVLGFKDAESPALISFLFERQRDLPSTGSFPKRLQQRGLSWEPHVALPRGRQGVCTSRDLEWGLAWGLTARESDVGRRCPDQWLSR